MGAQTGTSAPGGSKAARWSDPRGQPHIWGFPGREPAMGRFLGETEPRLSHPQRLSQTTAPSPLKLRVPTHSLAMV